MSGTMLLHDECFDVTFRLGKRTGRWFATCPSCPQVLDGLTRGVLANILGEHMAQRHNWILQEDWNRPWGNA